MISVEFRGIDEVIASLDNVAKMADEAIIAALYTQALRTATKAVTYTPVDTGALRGSKQVIRRGDHIEITFGGPAASYAIYVHEILRYRHPIGQAKFLERAVTEDADAFIKAASKGLKL